MEVKMVVKPISQSRRSERGATLVEMIIVCMIIAIVCAMAIPLAYSGRRKFNQSALPRQVQTQLRLTRQEAMSQQQAITFQYDDTTKRINIIDHQAAGRALLADLNYPDTPGSIRTRTLSLAGQGLPAGEIVYGIPTGAPTGALTDTATLTARDINNRVNITFQPDGSVINAAGNAVNFALYFYNYYEKLETVTAISVLGSGGRSKTWRFDKNANAFVE